MRKVLAIDIGGTFVKWALIGDDYKIISEDKFRSNQEYLELLDDLCSLISRYYSDIEAVSIAIPAGYDKINKTIFAPNLIALNNRSLHRDISDRFSNKKVILIENDANLAALGEYYLIENSQISNMIFLTLGTGFGGGAIIDGKILSSYATTFEVGHTVVMQSSRVCGCGRVGCLDEYLTTSGLEFLYSEIIADKDIKISPIELAKLADQNNDQALKTFERFADILGSAITNLANIFAPDKIKIGGGLSELARYYLDDTKRYVERNIFPLYKDRVIIEVASLKNRAGVIGGAVNYFNSY